MNYAILVPLAFISALVFGLINKGTTNRTILVSVIAAIIEALIVLWGHPTIGFWYLLGVWRCVIMWGLVGSAVAHLDSLDPVKIIIKPGVIVIILIVIGGVSSCEMFHSERFKTLIGDVTEKNFTQDVPFINPKKIRMVPKETALNLAKKVLGQSQDGQVLGSQLSIDSKSAAIQEVCGELWWIFPLDWSGFWKWVNRDYVPGYIRINAHNPRAQAQLVDKDPATGKEFKIKYTPNAYMGGWLDRKVYNKYPFFARVERTYEVDNNWRPYYVYSAVYPTIGFDGYKTKGVVIADPQTGDCIFHDEMPDWVDRIKPMDQSLAQVNYRGKFVEGYWNTWFGKKNIQKATEYGTTAQPDMWFVELAGKKYWFTGMTSASSDDQALVGLMFVNTRSIEGEAIYYNMAGTDEDGVVEAVQETLNANKMTGICKMPVPGNFYGRPTWIVIVVSESGIFQYVALVDISNINTRAIGKNLSSAMRKYRQQLTQDGNNVTATDSGMLKEIVGKVTRKWQIGAEGDIIWHLMLDSAPDKVFTSNGGTMKSVLIGAAKDGEEVKLLFLETEEGFVPVEEVVIHGLTIKKSKIQKALEAQRDETKAITEGLTDERQTDAQWDNLTPEQRKEALKALKKKK